ncbi:MAG: hypothetical protein CLLPBCKN_008518 [Chroococcidiopsis cubana SAG 39.79]|jgi:hypothetical protein|uniref:Uncharacterized protein n=1 Tax=Chroococcidiopsis cubana SAG 39.79 TaxID=388085 RepID=A0AB37UBD6_9CYAN|nr:hypothetical protein [Chroococcidiopsis cubana]MDZ4879080.1 hypothetical protein [Chroococcidiopsis cubana SAG 39.79]PSB64066.1 hypothetical protein C7B79_11295 [Chroococcidiopsis cubana CCALA 043]RUT01950.1 hypothetical protein DSM107010_64220 [Chroococcidiopsis cubana SAG 39.79]
MNLPQLPREPIRPELENPTDKEIWVPKWRCFCCRDTGLVGLNLVRLAIPNYDQCRDKPVACQNPRCYAGSDYRGDPNYDQRFTVGICTELDKRSREDWQRTAESHFKTIQNRVVDASRGVNLRKRDGREANRLRHRTSDEEIVANKRHELACSADPEKLEEADLSLDECEEKAYDEF